MVRCFFVFPLRMRIVYTDGSCLWNPGPWWWACLLQSDENTDTEEIILTWGIPHTTNNVMELTAAIHALQRLWERYTSKTWVWHDEHMQDGFFAAEPPDLIRVDESITIITDSKYVKLGITERIVTRKRRQRRRAKGGKLVEHGGLRKQLDALVSYFPHLERQRTKAHVWTTLNERVDQLARDEAMKYQ